MSIKITLRKRIFLIGSHIRHSKTEELHHSKYSLQLQNLSVDFTKKIVFAYMKSFKNGHEGDFLYMHRVSDLLETVGRHYEL